MSVFQICSLVAMCANLLLGVFVFFMNPGRRQNRYFLVITLSFALWLSCFLFGSFTKDKAMIMFWIRQSSMIGAIVPVSFDFFRMSIIRSDATGRVLARAVRPWIIILLPIAIMCQTDLFLRDVIVTPSGFGEPVYGPGQFVYMAYWLIALSLVIWRLGRDAWATSGIRKAELNFMLLASSLATVVSVTLGLIMPLTTGSKHLAQYVPLSVVLFDAVIAYGIVKKRIMDVGYIFRQAAAYGLFTSYLVGLYSVVYFASDFLLSTVSAYHTTLAHFVSALAIGFSMAPAHGMMQRAAKHLFINLEVLDIGDAMHQSQSLLTSIGTTDELLERFAEITVKATGTDRVLILMTEDGGFVQRHPMPEEGEGERISSDSPLAQLLKQETSPVTVDSLRRGRKTIMGEQARNQLEELKVTTAVSINTKEKQEGILLLGRRISGKIYSAMEQNALQLLCNQLGVALENAKLYTQAQNSRIYNDILLENLVSGVVAADSNGKVTRFNREAQRITGLAPRQVLGTAIQTLPDPLGEYMAATFSTGRKETEEDTILHLPEDKQVHIRLGTSLFHGRSGEILGCLLVFHDLTALKKLQAQIRRSDRLASMGTLSAGMAHEIKNPLVTIKTFTQLLPERHADEEFRKEFRSLVGSEVKRIDGIVNELLSFSRSSQPKLGEVKLHTVLEDSLHLVEQELNRNNIELLSEFKANEDLVRGDADLLSQAFVNFLLNSVAAMDGGGRMTVKTENILDAPAWSTKQDNGTRSIQITFSDTGSGIEQSDLSRIFDPFFTTKSEGTGLGLSVSHGIIEEHQGNVEVESRPGVGTTFYIRFPVLDKEAAA